MSRAIIGGVVTALILVLTAAAYFVTASKLESKIESDVTVRVKKAQDLMIQNAKLESLSLLKRIEDLARDENLLSALQAETGDVADERAKYAFSRFRAKVAGAEKIDILALLDETGDLVVLQLEDESQRITNPGLWKKDGKLKYPGIALALGDKPEETALASDIWNHEGQGLMKVGVAPVIDYDSREVKGAVVVAYSLSAGEAQRQSSMLGAEVAFFDGTKVSATSFQRSGQRREEDTAVREPLAKALSEKGLSEQALSTGFADPVEVSIGGETYLASAGRLVRYSSKGSFPDDYPPQTDGAMVLISMDKALEPVGAAKMGILLVGGGAVVIVLLAIWMLGRRITHQADAIENGLAEIINGNLDYSFRPVGQELDGIGNGLNVMLARLLGRPEPGEEEYDEDGNIIQPGKLDFDTQLSDKDEEAVRLAQEPEPDYYKRIYSEYLEARKSVGEPTDGINFDGFVTKLRVNEGNLKARYQATAIRFKVVVADGKVSLKPVPIM